VVNDHLTAGCGCHGCTVEIPRLLRTLEFISVEAERERKGLRRGAPTPVQGVDAGLQLMQLAADEALRKPSALRMFNLLDYGPRLVEGGKDAETEPGREPAARRAG
jgi:hypothetical protein